MKLSNENDDDSMKSIFQKKKLTETVYLQLNSEKLFCVSVYFCKEYTFEFDTMYTRFAE